MQKIFLSYRFTGEDAEILKGRLGKVKTILKLNKYEVFCSFFEEEFFVKKGLSTDQIYDYCKQELKCCEVVLFFIGSNKKSKGMEMELDEAIKAKKRIVVVIQKDLEFVEFRNSAHEIIEYDNLEKLYGLLEIEFGKNK